MIHLNNLLVFIGFYFYAASGLKTRLTQKVRHPQLSGFKAWALAHLLVVGSVQGVILFGGPAGLGGGVGHCHQPREP